MTKQELEETKLRYHELLLRSRESRRAGKFHDAIRFAMESWEFVDGMMQFERRYKKLEFDSIASVDIVTELTKKRCQD